MATIYNFRIRLKCTGTVIPSAKRGRKPKDKKVELIATPGKRGRKPNAFKVESKKVEAPIQKVAASVKMEQYNFIINGVTVTVSGKAKNVHIAADAMVVNF